MTAATRRTGCKSRRNRKRSGGSFSRRGLTPAQEAVAVVLRKTLLVSIDDLLAVVREFLNPEVSRSGLDRCLQRHGVGNLRDLQGCDPRPKHKAFKAYEPGYLHVDVKYLPQMADESSRRYLFVAIDPLPGR